MRGQCGQKHTENAGYRRLHLVAEQPHDGASRHQGEHRDDKHGHQGAQHDKSLIQTLRLVHLEAGERLDIPVTSGHNAFVYVVKGEMELEGRQTVRDEQMAVYDREGDSLRYYSQTACEFLLLGGQPLNEPVVSYGPFVMNSREQINRCYQNYKAGRMGEL